MRVDGKAEGPRQSMSWLHTWSSLILGWLLYAIFLTGTLSFFQNEISVWMKPELHQSIVPVTQQQQAQVALNYLQKNHANAGSWSIQLPNSRQNTTVVSIRGVGEDPRARRGGQRITLDSTTGQVIQARETRGGGFLYRFHFELYGLPRGWARWIVGIATMFMLVAIISGIITHKKIFKDFFTFRSGKGQRSWLDAHNATAVLALPFHIMITFSGLLLLLFTIMPWGVSQVYENRQAFLQDQRKGLIQNTEEPTEQRSNRAEMQARGEGANSENRGERPSREGGAEGGGERRSREAVSSQAAPLADLNPILSYAQQQWPDNRVGSINIIAPNTDQAKIELQALYAESVAYRGVYSALAFNGVTGQEVVNEQKLATPSIATGIYNTVTVLHEARGVDLSFRWLLFFSGILGTVMVATGLVLWCVKRAPQQFKQGKKSFGYRLVEVLNVAAVAGLSIACAAYFYANRFIPASLENRSSLEIRTFFIVWLFMLLHAAIRQHKSAWKEQLLLAAVAFALLPILNFMTGGAAIWTTLFNGQWLIATFDLAMWVLATVFFLAFYRVKNHQGTAPKKGKAKAESMTEQEA